MSGIMNTNSTFGELTRGTATTGYSPNQVVAPATGTVTEIVNCARMPGGSGYITGIRISTNKKSITPRFRIHFYNTAPVTMGADYASWVEVYADNKYRYGYYDMPAMTTAADSTNSDMSRAIDMNVPRMPFKCASGNTSIYFALETLDAFTPANGQLIRVSLDVEQN